MSIEAAATRTLLMGIGNVLLRDDGIGVHVIRALEALDRAWKIGHRVTIRDGGTVGLALLPELDSCGALIAIDAMQLGSAPGTVRAFAGPDMDAQLGGKKRTAHEVALADLMVAGTLVGCVPQLRALVAIQPGSTNWGLAPTQAVLAAIPTACQTVISLLEDWEHARAVH